MSLDDHLYCTACGSTTNRASFNDEGQIISQTMMAHRCMKGTDPATGLFLAQESRHRDLPKPMREQAAKLYLEAQERWEKEDVRLRAEGKRKDIPGPFGSTMTYTSYDPPANFEPFDLDEMDVKFMRGLWEDMYRAFRDSYVRIGAKIRYEPSYSRDTDQILLGHLGPSIPRALTVKTEDGEELIDLRPKLQIYFDSSLADQEIVGMKGAGIDLASGETVFIDEAPGLTKEDWEQKIRPAVAEKDEESE